jgi:hypothetical protein
MFWAWLPVLGPVRWTTVLAFTACIVVGAYRFGLVRGVLASMAGISSFEIVFNATGAFIHHWPFGPLLWMGAALMAWPILALREGIRPSAELVVAFAFGWVAWIVQGFTFNVASHDLRTPDFLAESLNATTKSLLVMAWALPSLGWIRKLGSRLQSRARTFPAEPDSSGASG